MPVATKVANLSASGIAIPAGDYRIVGIAFSTSTSLTIKLWDNTAGSGNVLLNTTAAITAPAFWQLRVSGTNGCYVTFGGTGSISIYYEYQ